MSLTIYDKRKVNRDRTAENRQRFLKRIKSTIQEQIPHIISGRSLKDMDQHGGKIRVSRKTVHEPHIHHGPGGSHDRVLPGNNDYVPGDYIFKDRGGSGGRGRKGSPDGEGEDDFIVELSREEFLKEFFEGMELPDLVQTELTKIKESTRENAGFQPDGSPNRLALVRSYKNSLARRLALTGGIDAEVEELEVEEALALGTGDKIFADGLRARINELLERKGRMPIFEDVDLRYRTSVRRDVSVAHATMIMIMDNSGSMGEREKTIARKFFYLLYGFLRRNYDDVDLVFVSHTINAKEMTEDEFFVTRDTGGTIVSSALDLTSEIIRKRLKGKTNVYIAQVTDGDNYDADNGTCYEILEDDILPETRYFAYIQVDREESSIDALIRGESSNTLWKTYKNLQSAHKNLQARRVSNERDIYPVLHELFSKKS